MAHHPAVDSFIRALAHRERAELGARATRRGIATRIVYGEALRWPWPRVFDYRTEFFCIGAGADSLRAVQRSPAAHAEHVVNLFAAGGSAGADAFVAAGYVLAWTSGLLARALGPPESRPLPEGLRLHAVDSPQAMARYASLPGISNAGAGRSRFIHNVFATLGPEVVAKGQLVRLPGDMAYISDIFTAPGHRRLGLSQAVLAALERRALRLGATHACLAPGREAAAIGLYERRGYAEVAVRSVLIGAEPRAGAPRRPGAG